MRVTVYMLAIGITIGLGGCTTLPDRQTVAKNSAEFVNRAEAMLAAQRSRLAEVANDLKADSPTARRNEVNNLLRQSRIDPLTQYLNTYANDPRYVRERARVRAERNRRCDAVGDRYARRDATPANLERFRRGYSFSCPTQIASFERRVNSETSVAEAKPEPQSEPKSVAAPRAANPAPPARTATRVEPTPAKRAEPTLASRSETSVVRTTSQSSPPSEAASSCYLLYAIKNFQQAHGDCLQAARAGDAKAQHHLADIALISKEDKAARHWAQASAEQQYPAGQMLMARLLQKDGEDAEALALLKRAADSGLTEANYLVGQAYLEGDGAPVNAAEAIRYLTLAAERNDVEAQLLLARLYASSEHANASEARRWLTRAAEQESAEAQLALGMNYYEGRGGPVDYREAYVWLSRAMLNGNERAREHLERIAPELTEEQLGDAQARVQSGLAGRRP
ncbi:hypothetical protein SAMN05216421_0636 [Halopseudomonas xinjiangensis]|uniref:Sel1 repeat-containing protein n=1 Tax=Halopseudomonas xinjiangensis TaxID=487184 RepID=A0A1H1N9C4_9GAMM|nr:tetratricopeptide repeat protein [Halopseudomonas xinjiangensis]SDR95592.1 hypothetical protein SAMN05216421_0636 [Halopseudomonas xinjiangensis]